MRYAEYRSSCLQLISGTELGSSAAPNYTLRKLGVGLVRNPHRAGPQVQGRRRGSSSGLALADDDNAATMASAKGMER